MAKLLLWTLTSNAGLQQLDFKCMCSGIVIENSFAIIFWPEATDDHEDFPQEESAESEEKSSSSQPRPVDALNQTGTTDTVSGKAVSNRQIERARRGYNRRRAGQHLKFYDAVYSVEDNKRWRKW